MARSIRRRSPSCPDSRSDVVLYSLTPRLYQESRSSNRHPTRARPPAARVTRVDLHRRRARRLRVDGSVPCLGLVGRRRWRRRRSRWRRGSWRGWRWNRRKGRVPVVGVRQGRRAHLVLGRCAPSPCLLVGRGQRLNLSSQADLDFFRPVYAPIQRPPARTSSRLPSSSRPRRLRTSSSRRHFRPRPSASMSWAFQCASSRCETLDPVIRAALTDGHSALIRLPFLRRPLLCLPRALTSRSTSSSRSRSSRSRSASLRQMRRTVMFLLSNSSS